MSTVEEWRAIPGWEGVYEASSLGRVRSLDRTVKQGGPHGGGARTLSGRVLRQSINQHGRPEVSLSRNGAWKTHRVHQLVAAAFHGPRPAGMDTCHSNGIRTDNRSENLRYAPHSDNELDKVAHGTHREARKTTCPLGHDLVPVNVPPSSAKAGKRQCLACMRTRARLRKQGRPFDATEADVEYARIMRRAAA